VSEHPLTIEAAAWERNHTERVHARCRLDELVRA
jgi:hypothetical protein